MVLYTTCSVVSATAFITSIGYLPNAKRLFIVHLFHHGKPLPLDQNKGLCDLLEDCEADMWRDSPFCEPVVTLDTHTKSKHESLDILPEPRIIKQYGG